MSAVAQGFAIIDAVTAAGRTGMRFTDIVAATAAPKASVHRLLRELVNLSALVYDNDTRCYRGGLLLARFGGAVMADFDFRIATRPFLQALHDTTGHVSTLGVRADDTGIYIDKIEPSEFGIRLHSEIGKQFPLHCTAMGKVLLAHSDAATQKRLSGRKLESFTENTITDPGKLRDELCRVKTDGYALDREEITRGLVCAAAPIFDMNGQIAGAISSTVPSYVAIEQGIDGQIAAVRAQARDASAFQTA